MVDVLTYFTWLDYSLFFGMLVLSAILGVYFGFFENKQDSPKEYLHGGKNMKILPIAASLIASDISGITLLAVPADIYINGSAWVTTVIATIFMGIVINYVFLPVFYTLQVTSSYEYLKIRFSNRICVMASFIFTIVSILFIPVVIFIPSLALNQVSGLSLNIVIPIVCLICIFYTTIGGIKAVVWTDTFQMVIMVGSLLVVFFLGVYVEGGFGNIWNKAEAGGRVYINFSANPTDKTAIITVLIGLTVFNCGHGSNPMIIQRFMTLPTIRDAKITTILFCIGAIFFKFIGWFLGLIMYSYYSECSPLATGEIKKPDQILPYYIMQVSSAFPGLPGIFVAGLFGAALSTVSSALNTLGGTVYEDFLKCRLSKDTTDKRASDIMKLIVVVSGILITCLVFAVQYLGAILEMAITLGGIVSGPILGYFLLGMLTPIINEKGVFYGSLGGIVFITWLILGSYYYTVTGALRPKYLPLPTDGCNITSSIINTTMASNIIEDPEPPMYLYRISYYYYSFTGLLVMIVIAFPVSIFTGGLKQKVDRKLLSPFIHGLLSKHPKISDDYENAKELEQLNC